MTELSTKNSPSHESAEDKLGRLRQELANRSLQGYLIPKADEFQGEYVPEASERLAWLTGFTGSAGTAAILSSKAAVYSDSRYTIQLEDQVDAGLYHRGTANYDTGDTLNGWIEKNVSAGDQIGYDPKLFTVSNIAVLEKRLAAKNVTLVPVEQNLIDLLWDDQPAEPTEKVSVFPDSIAGASATDKIQQVAGKLKDSGTYAVAVTAPDSIAWLLNIRGNDVPHTPVALSYATITQDGDVTWFIDENKITPDVRQHLGNNVAIRPIDELPEGIADISAEAAGKAQPVQIDFEQSSAWFKTKLEASGAEVTSGEDPCVALRAIKTEAERQAIREAHIRDAVALTKFLKWIDDEAPSGQLTELSVEKQLLSFRQEGASFADTSFDTIAGWADHGAIVHYRATEESNATIAGDGLLLVDSGAQDSAGGTTDITRTIAIGTPTADMIENFTLVLKGHIDVAKQIFPHGKTGADIDILARNALWQAKRDYGHGTGHGVGCYLSVHERGTGIHSRMTSPLQSGMLISNEPGYYKKDEYGIRIENLILVQDDGTNEMTGAPMRSFETVSLAPIDRRLIDASLLDADELAWLNDYHQRVYDTVAPLLNEPDLEAWLKNATAPIAPLPGRTITAGIKNNGPEPR